MKMRGSIKKVFIVMLMVILGIGTTSSFAMQDYQENDAKSLTLSYFRYVNGKFTDGYALNTKGEKDDDSEKSSGDGACFCHAAFPCGVRHQIKSAAQLSPAGNGCGNHACGDPGRGSGGRTI